MRQYRSGWFAVQALKALKLSCGLACISTANRITIQAETIVKADDLVVLMVSCSNLVTLQSLPDLAGLS